jgi:hypothetical protein
MSKEVLHQSLKIDQLVPSELNPNQMSPREFDLLVQNIDEVGFTDPVLVMPLDKTFWGGDEYTITDESKFRIIGGHHRLKAGEYLDMTEVPCSIFTDPEFTEEMADMQLMRHNIIKGRLDPSKFMKMYETYATKGYADEIIQEMFGFAEEAEFQRLIQYTASTLPADLQAEFKEAAKEIKTIDELSKLLNRLFTEYGDTLPYNYMFLDYGGKESLWIRMGASDYNTAKQITAIAKGKGVTVDSMMIALMYELIDNPDLKEKIVDQAVEVKVPAKAAIDTDEIASGL